MKKVILNRKVLLTVLCFTFFLSYFWRAYDALISESPSSWVIEPKADCAVVLTGGQGRVREGFDLLAHKAIKKLVISGVNPNVSLREIMPLWPFYGELHEEDVVLDRRSGTTYGNAQQTLPIVEALRCRDIILVTSQIHMSRAYLTFKASYPERINILKHSILASRGELGVWEVSTEVLKSLFYSLWAY